MLALSRLALTFRRERFLLWAFLPVVVVGAELSLHAGLAVVVAAAFLLVLSGCRSVAWPVGLAGFAAPVIAILGRDPFPKSGAPLILFAWLVLAVLVSASRGEMDGDLRKALSSTFVFLSAALFALMLFRRSASLDLGYADFKLQVFLIGNLMLLVAGIFLGRRPKQFDLFLLLLLAIDALSGILVLRTLGGPGPTAAGRYGSQLENVIALGAQGAEGLMVATYLMLRAEQRWQRLVATILLPVTLIALLASGSRGPVLGGALGLLVLLVLLARSRTSVVRILRLFLVFAIAWVAVNQIVPQSASNRALSALTGTASGLNGNGRSQLWSSAWHTFVNHPILGAGTGSFAAETQDSACTGPACAEKYPHNILLEVAAELGIAGLALTVGLLVAGGALILRLWRGSTGETRSRASILFALYVSSLTSAMLTGDISGDGGIWLAAGLGIGLTLSWQATSAGGRLIRAR